MTEIKQNIKIELLNSGYFIDNVYFDEYIDLLCKNINTEKTFHTQRHHKLPRHYYKHNKLNIDNSSNNLINLSFSDHIKAHYLLSLCCFNDNDRISNEASLIRMIGKKPIDFYNLPKYDELYNEYQIHNRDTHIGKTHITSQETREKIGTSNKGKYSGHIHIFKDDIEKHISSDELNMYLDKGWQVGRPERVLKNLSKNYNYNSKGMLGKHQSDYQKQKVREALKGISKSSDTKNNMKLAHKDKILVSNDDLNKSFYINKDELDLYVNKGFRRGRLNKKITV